MPAQGAGSAAAGEPGIDRFLRDNGYWYSRSLAFYDDWTPFQWLRAVGDTAFLVAGTLVFLDLLGKLRFRRPATVGEEVPLPALPAERPLPA